MTVQLVDGRGRPTTWRRIVAERMGEVAADFERPFIESAAKRTGGMLRGRSSRIPRATGRLRRGVKTRGVVGRNATPAHLVNRRRVVGRIEVRGSGPHYNRGTRDLITRAVEGDGRRLKPLAETQRFKRAIRRVARRQLRKAAERTNARRGGGRV